MEYPNPAAEMPHERYKYTVVVTYMVVTGCPLVPSWVVAAGTLVARAAEQ